VSFLGKAYNIRFLAQGFREDGRMRVLGGIEVGVKFVEVVSRPSLAFGVVDRGCMSMTIGGWVRGRELTILPLYWMARQHSLLSRGFRLVI